MSRIKPVEWTYTKALRAAMRFARRAAEKHGYGPLRRFKNIHPLESDAGPSWVAKTLIGKGTVTLWYPIGEDRQQECRQTCQIVKEFGSFLFGLDFRS